MQFFMYDTKLHLMVRLKSWNSDDCGVPLHYHYSQFIKPVVVQLVRVPSMGQDDMFKSYYYSIEPCAKKGETTQNI